MSVISRLKWYLSSIVAIALSAIFFCGNAKADDIDGVVQMLSNMYNMTSQESTIIVFVATSEKAAKLCNFDLNNNFYYSKNEIIKQNKYKDAYNLILDVPLYDNLDVNNYCNQWYEIAGPRTGSRAFYR